MLHALKQTHPASGSSVLQPRCFDQVLYSDPVVLQHLKPVFTALWKEGVASQQYLVIDVRQC
jgi:hypothetical protein